VKKTEFSRHLLGQ